ncbi:capsular biosynthesis protein, partial [Vibrio parahaemolyticus]
EHGHEDLVEIGRDTSREQAAHALAEADFVYHLAGINRPKTEAEFQEGNADFTDFVVEELKGSGKKTPLVVSSSTQALQNNTYGQSKRAAEQSVER